MEIRAHQHPNSWHEQPHIFRCLVAVCDPVDHMSERTHPGATPNLLHQFDDPYNIWRPKCDLAPLEPYSLYLIYRIPECLDVAEGDSRKSPYQNGVREFLHLR